MFEVDKEGDVGSADVGLQEDVIDDVHEEGLQVGDNTRRPSGV